MAGRPKLGASSSEQEIDKVEAQFDAFNDQVKELASAPLEKMAATEVEVQTKLSNREINRDAKALMPSKSISRRDKFNEDFRADLNRGKRRVNCVVENKEQPGAIVEVWTGPWGGYPCEFWEVPVNKPINIPLYLAEQLATRQYRVLTMDENKHTGSDGAGTYYGQLVAEEMRKRIDCREASSSFVSMAF